MAATEAEPYVGLVNVEGLLRKAESFTDGEFSGMAAKLGIEGHLDKLIRSLTTINHFIFDAETRINLSGVRSWLKEINLLFAPLDDLLDEFAYEARRPKVKLDKVGRFFSASNRNRKMSHRLKDVGSKYEGLARRASEINVANASGQHDHFRRRETDSFCARSEIMVGGADLLNLKEKILGAGNDPDLSFISIIGMAGIGKTTLAKVVYNDDDVMYHFDVKIWICVSKESNTFRILQHMLESLTHHPVDEMSIETVLLKLLERLKGKKYLLVLDDVWEQDYSMWDSFTKYLLKLGGSRGSKILVTTRLEQVADLFKPGSTYKVNFLPEEYCWKLFRQIVIEGSGRGMTQQQEEVGRTIVNSCGGLPLAVKAMASIARYRKIEDWDKLAINEAPGSEFVDDVLKLSYDNLPSISLKQCFLYCSIFPKGSLMEKDELIQLWTAQGLLNPPQGRNLSMEDLGAEYLGILVGTSILQDAELDEVDGKKFYKMHDLLHDLALSLSKYQCSIMEGEKVATDHFGVHLSVINCEVSVSEPSKNECKRLRTLRWVNSGVLGDLLAYATSLRVLIVDDWSLEELPASISKLKLLYYLDISKTKIQELPDTISTLYNLQILRLYDLIGLPKNFENLVNLRHLYIGPGHLYIEKPRDLDKLSALPSQAETVLNPSSLKACFKVHLHDNYPTENFKKLSDLPDLYSCLRIYRLENVSGYEKEKEEEKKAIKEELSRISKISTIESLRLHWNARRENCYDEGVLEDLPPHSDIKHLAIENYKGTAFPSWMQNTSEPPILHHLEKIELEDCSYCEQLPPLGHLPFLKVVKISGMVNVKSIGAEFYGLTDVDGQSSSSGSPLTARTVFPKLRELTLRELISLVEWSEPVTLSNHVCPLLEKFEVEQCPKLKRLPNVITSSHEHLRRLEVAWCDSLDCLPEGVVGLKSLEDLEARGLPSLSKLSIGHCRNLTSLTIGGISDVDNTQPLHLTEGSGELASLPEQLQYLSALKFFTISGYGGLESLPEWFSKLQFLQILKLEFCWKLMHLPEAEKMQQLKNLDELDICYCPLLEARCTKGSRPELHKISHIPRIMINFEEIKFRPLNKNKNTTNAQTQRNKEKDIEKSGNRERNEGEGEQQGRSAASSSSQLPDQSAGVGNEETLIKDSASPPKPSQQQEPTAIGSNSTDDVPSVESKDKGKGKAKLSAQTVVGGPPSRSRGIVINEGGFKEREGAGSDRTLYKDSASPPSPSLRQEKTGVASDSNDDVPVSANPSVESKGEDKSKSAGAGNERMLVQDSASLPNPPQLQEITAIGYDSNDDKPSIKSKDEVMAKLPTPTVVGAVSSDTYGIFNDENASKKVELSKVVVNEFSESSGAGNKRALVKGSKSPPSLPQKQEITAVGFNSDDDVPVLAKPYIESKDERTSRLPAVTTVNGVSSGTIGTEIEELASKEVELSKESVNEYFESSGAGNGSILVKASTSPTYPPPHQEITAFGSNSGHAVPVSTGPSVESKDEGKSKLPTLNVVGGVSSDTSCTAVEVKASKEVELSKELATEFSEIAGTGREKTLVKGNAPLISPPQQQVMDTMGSDSDDDARFLAKHFYQMKR
ncbi:disease resistance protein RGA2-like isoform X2 [Coffea arabica]|uniref:Disease resistance protein RGA2-like isoform X2 n=1 Tax=Coffea arabica TaxID=13443 RepID=A0ABM4X2M9_COFAR